MLVLISLRLLICFKLGNLVSKWIHSVFRIVNKHDGNFLDLIDLN